MPTLQTVTVVLGVIIAVPLAAKAVHWFWTSLLNGAEHVVRLRKAADLVLYELAPNDGLSIKDDLSEVKRITVETQKALEVHLLEHQRFET